VPNRWLHTKHQESIPRATQEREVSKVRFLPLGALYKCSDAVTKEAACLNTTQPSDQTETVLNEPANPSPVQLI